MKTQKNVAVASTVVGKKKMMCWRWGGELSKCIIYIPGKLLLVDTDPDPRGNISWIQLIQIWNHISAEKREESKTKIGLYRISSLFYNRYPAGYQAKLLNKWCKLRISKLLKKTLSIFTKKISKIATRNVGRFCRKKSIFII